MRDAAKSTAPNVLPAPHCWNGSPLPVLHKPSAIGVRVHAALQAQPNRPALRRRLACARVYWSAAGLTATIKRHPATACVA